VVGSRRREAAHDAEMDALERADIEREVAKAARAEEREAARATMEVGAKADAAGWEVEGAEPPSIEGASLSKLSMEARVTEGPSEDVAKLWSGISEASVEKKDEEREALRLEDLKRRYQNAIGRLPYGIPSRQLQGMDWMVLANALATGEKKQVEGGKEVTLIEGRWYYSDHEDTGTFLKEHGAKPRTEPKWAAAPATDREALLAKLEERLILGEISERTYKDLKRKYEGD
jgi:hypothetical protein